jgi:predicted aspartyl protease
LALDTGATATLVNWDVAVLLGYDPSVTPARRQITTGSGVEFAPEIPIDRIEALGMERLRFPVLCHTLPPSAGVDGLLGLDFLRGQRMALDFRTGTITVD